MATLPKIKTQAAWNAVKGIYIAAWLKLMPAGASAAPVGRALVCPACSSTAGNAARRQLRAPTAPAVHRLGCLARRERARAPLLCPDTPNCRSKLSRRLIINRRPPPSCCAGSSVIPTHTEPMDGALSVVSACASVCPGWMNAAHVHWAAYPKRRAHACIAPVPSFLLPFARPASCRPLPFGPPRRFPQPVCH